MSALLTRAQMPDILLRLAVGTLLSIAMAWWTGPSLAQAFLPSLKWVYAHIDTDNDVVSLEVSAHGVNYGDDRVYALTIAPHPYIYVGDKLVATNTQGRGRVSVLTGYLWQPLVVALPLLLAWPVRRRSEWPIRAVAFLAVGIVVILVDLPTLLWSEVWSYYVGSVAPGKFSFLLIWGHLLKNGGQTLLGIVIAVLSVSLGQAFAVNRSTFRLHPQNLPPQTPANAPDQSLHTQQ